MITLLSICALATGFGAPEASPATSVRVPFVQNVGQEPSEVAFRAALFAGTACVTHDGRIAYALAGPAGGGATLIESFVGAHTLPVGASESRARVSRFVGADPARWASALPTFERVELGQAWPGVRIELAARAASVEKLFSLAPGADPDSIRIQLEGACGLAVDEQGALVVATDHGEVRFSAPIAWQELAGAREPVEIAYWTEGERYGFRLGAYDRERELWIDPLLETTYFGGYLHESLSCVAVDPTSGSVYVAGGTPSPDLPGTAGGAQPALNGPGGYDGFVAKLSADLSTLEQATYLGGYSNGDGILAIAIGSSSVYVAGGTSSVDYPLATSGGDPVIGGFTEGVVARLSLDLTTVLGASYAGGNTDYFNFPQATNSEVAFDLALDPVSGSVYVVGKTSADDLPGAAGGAAATRSGLEDAFVMRFSADLSSVLDASYLGGTGDEAGLAIAFDAASSTVFVGGRTDSTDLLTLTTSSGGLQSAPAGLIDGFVATLNASLSSFGAATYLGDGYATFVNDLQLAPGGTPVVVGSTFGTLPWAAAGAQPGNNGGEDAFVVRLNAGLSAALGATHYGGTYGDYARGLAIDPASGAVYIAGETQGIDLPATAGGAQPNGYSGDAFVAKFPLALDALIQASYVGGTITPDYGRAIARSPLTGDVYVVGETYAFDLPHAAGGAQPTYAGSTDGFVARLDAALSFGDPIEHCAGGTSTNGCQATISANDNPSASLAHPCVLTVASVEGQKSGLVFYSLTGRLASPWCATSSSLLCIAAPRQRTGVSSSGGTLNACDGVLTLDWNAFQSANPFALGNPFAAGTAIDAQGWYRDPPACKATQLSNAVEMVIEP